jgi:hypothetical protein
MNIGFDISQTGSGKAGCGYFTHAMIKAMLAIAPQHHYALYPSFGDFFFGAKMPVLNPYGGEHVSYGPSHLTRETARAFWNQPELEVALGHPDIIHANHFWTPVQIASGRLIYTLYDVGFTVNPDWTTETNRVGCFDGIFRSSVAADWVVAISEYSRAHYLRLFPHFPSDRVRVVYPCSRFENSPPCRTPVRLQSDRYQQQFSRSRTSPLLNEHPRPHLASLIYSADGAGGCAWPEAQQLVRPQ